MKEAFLYSLAFTYVMFKGVKVWLIIVVIVLVVIIFLTFLLSLLLALLPVILLIIALYYLFKYLHKADGQAKKTGRSKETIDVQYHIKK